MHTSAKPFVKTNNSNSKSLGGIQGGTRQVQTSPKQLQSTHQISSFNLPASGQAIQQPRCKELNEKNLYLFDK